MAKPKFVLGAYELQFSKGLRYPVQKPLELMQVTDRDSAGSLEVEDLGLSIDRRQLDFKGLPLVDYNGCIDWFVNKSNGAMVPFTYHDEDGNTMQVCWTNSVYGFQQTSYQKFSGSIQLEVVG